MSESFSIQISSNLVSHLVGDGEKSKKKTRKPKPKTPQPQKSYTPLHLPITPPKQPTNAELNTILSIVRESDKIVDKLQKQEDNMLQEVTQRAKDLHDKEFKLPSHKLTPCLDEQDACLQCYKDYTKDPLKCAYLVENFAECARRARQQVSINDN